MLLLTFQITSSILLTNIVVTCYSKEIEDDTANVVLSIDEKLSKLEKETKTVLSSNSINALYKAEEKPYDGVFIYPTSAPNNRTTTDRVKMMLVASSTGL